MTIIPLAFSIHRNLTTQKKYYQDLKTKKVSDSPINLPKEWQSFSNPTNHVTSSYAIRPDDDLVIIDCDDLHTTDALTALTASDTTGYVVVSDKGEKHFYFAPSEYYRDSPLYRKSKIKAGPKIDVLHGNGCYAFAVCESNHTKDVHQGSLTSLTVIPDNVVDYLVSLIPTQSDSIDSDYSPVTSYLAPLIDSSLGLYSRSADYRDIQNMMHLITPSAYKDALQPDYHPDRVQAGEGIEYLKGVRAKLGRDPSVSLKLAIEVMTLITQTLWSEPLTNEQLKHITEDLPTRKYANGRPVFVYDPNATNIPLISMNGYPYMPVYRTLEDEYVIAKVNGTVEYIKGLSNFRKAVMSRNFKLQYMGQEITVDSRIPAVTQQMETVVVRHLPYQPSGTFNDNGTLTYNTYTPTKFLSIIRGDYLAEDSYRPNSTPTIDKLLNNLMADHEDTQKMISYFEQFVSYKLKTLEYSPIVFQILGNRGTGKGTLMTLLQYITNATAKSNFNASNDQFNKNFDGAMFINEDDTIITNKLIEALKRSSGSKTIDIEGKTKDKYTARNIATYIHSSNNPILLAQTVDDRRCVPLSSFTTQKLSINNLDTLIELEAEQWCLKLRDSPLVSHRLYHDATFWHDEIHLSLFRERTENVQDAPGQLALLITTQLTTLVGDRLYAQLETILGHNFHYTVTKRGIKLWLSSKSANPKRKSDEMQVTHQVTVRDVKNCGIGNLLKRDTTYKEYDGNIDYLNIELSTKQLEYFEARNITVAPIASAGVELD
jgi:hypothetical protein